MDNNRINQMREKAAKIRQEVKDFAETPEGKALNTRLKLSRNIIALLKSQKLSQAEFSRRIDMKPTQFNRIVQADENITLAMITRIADGFGVPESRLLRDIRQPKEPAGV